jgi:hypothetical protein
MSDEIIVNQNADELEQAPVANTAADATTATTNEPAAPLEVAETAATVTETATPVAVWTSGTL